MQHVVRGELKRVEREIVPSKAPTPTWLLTCVPYHSRNNQMWVVRLSPRPSAHTARWWCSPDGVVVTTLNITEVKLAQVQSV